eukprot:Nk52_evm37s230 gene=Nk52_evmTU37s230
MKFGKFLLDNQVQEWGEYYIDYKHLKHVIKGAEIVKADIPVDSFSDPQQVFFFALDRQLEKVTGFYVVKLEELKTRFQAIADKQNKLALKRQGHGEDINRDEVEGMLYTMSDFMEELKKVNNFVEFNTTGFRKILKKHDKKLQQTTQELYLKSKVDVQPFSDVRLLRNMEKEVNQFQLELKLVMEGTSLTVTSQKPSKARDALCAVVADNNVLFIGELLRRFAKENLPQGWCNDAVVLACKKTSVEIVKLLIEDGKGSVNAKESLTNRSCLHKAITSRNYDILRFLLEAGADVESHDYLGRRPIHFACIIGSSTCLKLLLEHKAQATCEDKEGYTPLYYAVMKGFVSCCRDLIEAGADMEAMIERQGTPLALACKYGHENVAKLFIEKGANVNAMDEFGVTPLFLSCAEGAVSCVQLLIENGADIEVEIEDSYWTPIFEAASKGHLECVKLLLAQGAKLSKKDSLGWTPGAHALFRGHIKIAKLIGTAPGNIPDREKAKLPAADNLVDDLDALEDLSIPPFELPPPALAFRHYGHTYLQKKVEIQISFGRESASGLEQPIEFSSDRSAASSLKLVVSAPFTSNLPIVAMLPLRKEPFVCSFKSDRVEDITLQFDIHSTFSEQMFGRAMVVFSSQAKSSGTVKSLVLNTKLELVGSIKFDYNIALPFKHRNLTSGITPSTYWKSTQVTEREECKGDKIISRNKIVDLEELQEDILPRKKSFVTKTSLKETYYSTFIRITADDIPIVCKKRLINVRSNYSVPVESLRLDQLTDFGVEFVRLSDALGSVSPNDKKFNRGLNIVCEFDCSSGDCDVDKYCDLILTCIYDTPSRRGLILSSPDPAVCHTFALKQPHHPVFCISECGFGVNEHHLLNSIQKTVKFAKRRQLLGVICRSNPLLFEPCLISVIKESGLLIFTYGKENGIASNVHALKQNSVDGVLIDEILTVSNELIYVTEASDEKMNDKGKEKSTSEDEERSSTLKRGFSIFSFLMQEDP